MTTDAPIDRRSLSHMAPEVKLVHLRLEIWGRWAKDKVPGDWPQRTILGRLIEEGPSAGHITGSGVQLPEAVAETDTAVAHLAQDEKRVILAFYTRWEPRPTMARRLRLNVKRFDVILNRARWRLVGWFSRE
jgi:hypothetical protein